MARIHLHVPEHATSLGQRLHDPAWRRYGYVLAAGKALGAAVTFVAMLAATWALRSQAEVGPSLARSLTTTLWMLIAALPVFGLQAVTAIADAGSTRARETARVLAESVADVCLCGMLFYAWGFAFMQNVGTPFFGTTYFFQAGTPATAASIGSALLTFWLFQFAFADTCATIRAAAMDLIAGPSRAGRAPAPGAGRRALRSTDGYRVEAR